MSSASWSPATDGSSASWSENKALSDLQAAAITYDDPNTAYDSITVYFDGYDPTGTTPEGEAGASWTAVTDGGSASWTGVSE